MTTLLSVRYLVFCLSVAGLRSTQSADAKTSLAEVVHDQMGVQPAAVALGDRFARDTQDHSVAHKIIGTFDIRFTQLVQIKEVEVLTELSNDAGEHESGTRKEPRASAGQVYSGDETLNGQSGDNVMMRKQQADDTKHPRHVRARRNIRSPVEPAEAENIKKDSSKQALLEAQEKLVTPGSDIFSPVNDVLKTQLIYTFIVWAALVMVVILLLVGYLKSRGWLTEKEYIVNYV